MRVRSCCMIEVPYCADASLVRDTHRFDNPTGYYQRYRLSFGSRYRWMVHKPWNEVRSEPPLEAKPLLT